LLKKSSLKGKPGREKEKPVKRGKIAVGDGGRIFESSCDNLSRENLQQLVK